MPLAQPPQQPTVVMGTAMSGGAHFGGPVMQGVAVVGGPPPGGSPVVINLTAPQAVGGVAMGVPIGGGGGDAHVVEAGWAQHGVVQQGVVVGDAAAFGEPGGGVVVQAKELR